MHSEALASFIFLTGDRYEVLWNGGWGFDELGLNDLCVIDSMES